MKTIPFRTQARTVDHLGREQIADCPTAISELWKNAYDAYAESVELHIFDGEEPVAAIFDDGHGMSYDEFVSRWLVVGTESKYSDEETPEEDRNGLNPRPKQGQKGIGRLSSANLGPLLLLVSKRKNHNFVAALIDWRIFENPFLTLEDIKIPVTEFEYKDQLFDQLPALFEGLTENIWGDKGDAERTDRIEKAWSAYDKFSQREQERSGKKKAPSLEIAETIIGACFDEKHIEPWPLWLDQKDHGTAMLVSTINFDLRTQIDGSDDVASTNAKTRMFETLSSFVDPFFDPAKPEINSYDPQFSYSVNTHVNNSTRVLMGMDKEFSRKNTDALEHIVEGSFDESGVFRGQIKAFGEWVVIGGQYEIPPPKDLKIHTRKDWSVGPVDFYISTFEQESKNTTHSESELQRFLELAERYAGFLIYRNNLRVLPYGRVDNDFFEIEMRRSKHAGREYWNSRRMFGRLALSRESNPNLKDKAGREGFIDNVAAKTLKILVENVLKRVARDYFGTASDLRKEKLPQLQAAYKEEKANEERNKLRKKQRSQFRTKLKGLGKSLPAFRDKISFWEDNLDINSAEDIAAARELLDEIRAEFTYFKLPGVPQNLGGLEKEFEEYRAHVTYCSEASRRIATKIDDAIQRISPPNSKELIEQQRQRNAAQIHNRIRQWKSTIATLQSHEQERIKSLIDERNKLFHSQTALIAEQVDSGDVSLSAASTLMEELRTQIDTENEEMFESYIRALESLTESIDLEMLAMNSTEENDELRKELDRLNGLAQLGITVEILGHELQSYDDMIGHGIRLLPKELQSSKAVSEIRMGYAGLTNQLRFLSPLKLSGEKIQKWLSGKDVLEYVSVFYGDLMERKGIKFVATDKFLAFKVFEQPSRIFPVFINLINNSMFWVGVSDAENKEIRLDVVGDEVVVSDNGPGVERFDIPKLFSLFFTKKLRGGRGVGLYIAKANLAAGGHKIRYMSESSERLLSGANFSIEFKGAEYGD